MIRKLGYSDRMVLLKKPFDNVEVLQLACSLTEKWRLGQEARLQLDELERLVAARTSELRNTMLLLQQSINNYKRTETRLIRSEERFRLITDNAADLIMVVDAVGRPQYFSPSVSRGLGYSLEEMQRSSLFSLVHVEDRPTAVDILKSALRNRSDQVLEFRLQHKQGYWRRFEAHASVVRENEANAGNLVLVARDITERDRAEKENFRLALQLQRTAESGALATTVAVIENELAPLLESVRGKVRTAEHATKALPADTSFAHQATTLAALAECQSDIVRIAEILAELQADVPLPAEVVKAAVAATK